MASLPRCVVSSCVPGFCSFVVIGILLFWCCDEAYKCLAHTFNFLGCKGRRYGDKRRLCCTLCVQHNRNIWVKRWFAGHSEMRKRGTGNARVNKRTPAYKRGYQLLS